MKKGTKIIIGAVVAFAVIGAIGGGDDEKSSVEETPITTTTVAETTTTVEEEVGVTTTVTTPADEEISDEDIQELAESICNALSVGVPWDALVQVFVDEGVEKEDAEILITLAVAGYCPDLLREI